MSGPAQGLVITSTPEGRFVYWPDKKPFALAKDDDTRLIICLETLPYQEGAPLSTIQEEEGGDTVVVESATSSSGSHSPSRELFAVVTPHDGDDPDQNSCEPHFPDEVSADELSADAPQGETEEQKKARRLRNTKRAERRRRLAAALLIRNLNETLAAVETRPHPTPEACVASINLIGRAMPIDRASRLGMMATEAIPHQRQAVTAIAAEASPTPVAVATGEAPVTSGPTATPSAATTPAILSPQDAALAKRKKQPTMVFQPFPDTSKGSCCL